MMVRRLVVAAAALLLLGACGSDDGSALRATGEPGAGATGNHAEVAECERVGDATKATSTVEVELQEFAILPAQATTEPGLVRFSLTNTGEEPHELVVIRADDAAALPTDADGALDEDQLPAGALIGEVEPFPGNAETCEGTFELAAGRYALVCNIVEIEDGVTEAHYRLGMWTDFTVA